MAFETPLTAGPERYSTELRSYISMVFVSLVGFLLGGVFVNVLYQEIFWALVSISIAIDRLSLRLSEAKQAD
jgi:hypothetical protein